MPSNNFYVAKVNVNQNIFSALEEVENIIRKMIPQQILEFSNSYKGMHLAKEAGTENEIRWTLANTEKQDDNLISGLLTKSTPLEYQTVTNENTVIDEQPDGKFKTEACFFTYFIEEELLAFDTNRFIPRDTFLTIFKELLEFEDGIINIGEVEIILKTETSSLLNIFLTKNITYFRVEIVHPNSRKKQFNSMRGIVTDMNAKKATFNMTNDSGLKILSDDNKKDDKDLTEDDLNPIVKDSLKMSEEGYAEIKVTYYDNGDKKSTSSKSSPLKVVIPNYDPTNIEKESVIMAIKNKLEKS